MAKIVSPLLLQEWLLHFLRALSIYCPGLQIIFLTYDGSAQIFL
jgi:hypothetical protein